MPAYSWQLATDSCVTSIFPFSFFSHSKFYPIRLLRNWKLLSIRKVLFLPHILSNKEQKAFLILIIAFLISGAAFFTRIYLRLTIPVPATGGTYTEGLLKEPRLINPIYAATDTDRDITRLVFSSLLTYSGSGMIEPDIAQKYEISQDGKTYIITLRDNVFWHDGKRLTADDVIFTIKTIQDPLYKSPLRPNWQGVEVSKLEENKIQFTLRSAYAAFIENLTVRIIPKHLWEQIPPEQAALHELNLKPVGSGPFEFDRMKQNKDGTIAWYQLQGNENFYKDGPFLEILNFSFFKTEEEIIAALRRGDIDGFGPLTIQKEGEFARDRVSILKLTMPRLFGIFFNERRAQILSDKKLREAIALAIPEREIAAAIASSGAIAADSILPSDSPQEKAENYVYSPEKSRELLETAGWRDDDNNGFREKRVKQKNKKEEIIPLQLTLMTSDFPELVRTASLIQDALEKVGVELRVESHPFAELETKIIRPRNFEILLFGQVYGHEVDPFSFWHSSQIKDPGLNISSYANKNVDRILEDARKSTDPAVRDQKHREFESAILQDIPAIFLYSQLYIYVMPADLKGVELSTISLPSDRFNETHKWYRTTRRIFK